LKPMDTSFISGGDTIEVRVLIEADYVAVRLSNSGECYDNLHIL